jgi:hypothetical protein
MTKYLYLSFVPEALVASQLPPNEFGDYYATGAHKKQRGQAMFAELDPDFRHDFFPIEKGLERCVPHEDGAPKKSVYISTYRVLEHIPLSALRRFYLVTSYGEVLGLDRAEKYEPVDDAEFHLYQEITPINPLVVSTLNPVDFSRFLTKDPESMIHLPAVMFVELRLGNLADDPEHGDSADLPYSYIHHLRECLIEVRHKDATDTKMVNRIQPPDFPFRMIKSGVFIANTEELAYYPLPPRDELRSKYYRWWRSANM